MGDLTIGDFWGINRFVSAPLDVEKGVSLIQANSEKGLRLLDQLKDNMRIFVIDRDKYLATTGAMVQPPPMNAKRSEFLEAIRKGTFIGTVNKFIPKYEQILKIEVARRIKPLFRKKIRKLLRK